MRILTVVLGAIAILVAVPVMGGFAGSDLYVASIGQGSGAGGSEWKTTVWLHNPGPTAADCEISFLLRNGVQEYILTYGRPPEVEAPPV